MLTVHDSALYLAKQAGRGIYPTAPTYMFEMLEGGLTSLPTIARLNIRDGRIFGASKKRVNFFDTGGQPTLTLQPKGIGALVAWAMGNDTPSGGADPYTHVSVPPTSLAPGAYPFVTGWQFDLGRWSVFHDMQIAALTLLMDVTSGWATVQPTFVGMAPEQHVAVADVPSLAGAVQETDTVHWVDASGYHCLNGDWTNLAHIALPTDLATLKTALASFKTLYNAHCAVASGRHHKAADATNVLSYSTPPADLAACIAALTEIRADLIAHEADATTVHYFADTTDNNPSAAWIEPCVTLADCLVAMQDLLGSDVSPGCYNRHLGAVANIRKVGWDFGMGAAPWQGTGPTAYTIIRKPGSIMLAVDQLQEDLRLINLAKFGTPEPATGDEVTSEIQTLGFTTKFIASVSGNERSIKIDAPQFDLDPEPLDSLVGNAEGTEPVIAVGGEATGTAPISTITTVNDVPSY